MNTLLSFAFLSLGPGALVAALGLCLVLTYRSSGVINFAAGATATFVAYSFYELRTSGSLFGTDLHHHRPMATVPAVALAVVVAVALGLMQYVLVYRMLRGASPLAKVVASTGIMLILNAIVVLHFNSDTRAVPPVLSVQPVSVLGVTVPADRLLLFAIVVVVALGLAAAFRYTQFGLATRAVADNRRGALLIGLNAGRLEAVNWVLSSVLAGLIGVLAGPAEGLTPESYTLLVVPALGAALIGGFASFIGVTVGAVALTIAQSFVTAAQGHSWFPHADSTPIPGVQELMAFLVIALALGVRGTSLPNRRSAIPVRLPRAPRPEHVALRLSAGTAFALLLLVIGTFAWRQALINTMIGAIVCLSLVVITGFVGQLTFAQLAVAGTAGFTTSRMAVHYGWGFPFGPLVALAVAVVASLIVSVPALRLRGMQLAVISLAGAVTITALWFDNPTFGGSVVPASVRDPSVLGIPLASKHSFWNGDKLSPSPGFGLFVLIVLVVLATAVVNLRRSPTGSRMLAVRADEAAAAAAGVNVAAIKLTAFAISGAIAGAAGVLYGYDFGTVTPERFDVFTAVSFLAVAYLGGITTVTGSVVAGALVGQGLAFHAATTWFGLSSNYQPLFAGVAVVFTVITNPAGITGFFRDEFERIAHRMQERSAEQPVPAQAATRGPGPELTKSAAR